MNEFREQRSDAARLGDAIREGWRWIVITIILAVGITAIVTLTAAKRYRAHADILVSAVPADDPTFIGIGILRESGDPTRSVITAARLVKSEDVIRRVERRLGPRARGLVDSVDVKPLGQANIVTVEATAGSPKDAAALANAFAEGTIRSRTEQFHADLLEVIDQLEGQLQHNVALPPARRDPAQTLAIEQRLSNLQPLTTANDPTLRIVNAAVRPGSPSWPRPVLSIGIAFLAATLIALAAAVALELANPRITREEELVFGQRLPILARIPRLSGRAARAYLTGAAPLPAQAWESYRTLRANLATAGPNGSLPRTVLVTSATPGEGKTMTAVNLAITLASGGLRVILVDADLRRPMVATVFGLSPARGGIRELFRGEAVPANVLVGAPGFEDDLKLVLASPSDADGVDLLDPRRVERFLKRLQGEADVVIVDSPAVVAVADALSLADRVESVLIVTRLGHTRRDQLSRLRELLSQRGVAPAGLVVTTRDRPGRYTHRYGQPRDEARAKLAVPQSVVEHVTGPGDA